MRILIFSNLFVLNFKVILEEHMYDYNGFDLYDPKILDDARRIKAEKKMTFDELYALFALEFVSKIF